MITDLEFIARGKRGIVSRGRYNGMIVAIKQARRESVDTTAHEARMLRKVNALGIGPRYISLEEGKLVMEFIPGPNLLQWIESAPAPHVRAALLHVLRECRTLDRAGITKMELHRPIKHILLRDGVPVQIDFERAREDLRPKNVTQLCQWLASGRTQELLEPRSVMLDARLLRALAKAYKQSYSDEAFEHIEREVRG